MSKHAIIWKLQHVTVHLYFANFPTILPKATPPKLTEATLGLRLPSNLISETVPRALRQASKRQSDENC